MRSMRVVSAFLMAAMMAVSSTTATAAALEATDPPELLPVSPLVISAYSVMGEMPQYIEIYNNGSTPLNAADWSIAVTWSLRKDAPAGSGVPVVSSINLVEPKSSDTPYIPPGGYIVAGFNGAVSNALSQISLVDVPNFGYVSELRLENAHYRPYTRSITEAQAVAGSSMRLNVGTTGYTSSYGTVNADKLYQDTDFYYAPSGDFPLAPIEIVANPKTCSPLDKDNSCLEYVKFYNHTTDVVDFSGTQLRAGTTTQALSGQVAAGAYALFAVPLANAGGYISLEDTYGLHTFGNTVVGYPDASATSKKGLSWAMIDGTWQWAVPNPGGANTPIIIEAEVAKPSSNIKQCRADQYRNPLTNRCKLITSASSSPSVKPCAANQYRSPETNRCRLVSASTASTGLKPCAANQYRSPETNRCRLLVSAAASLKPCADNQERNPETNRCRLTQSKTTIPTADYPVEVGEKSSDQSLGWVAFLGVGVMASGYAGWEWRYEIGGILRKLKTLVVKT